MTNEEKALIWGTESKLNIDTLFGEDKKELTKREKFIAAASFKTGADWKDKEIKSKANKWFNLMSWSFMCQPIDDEPYYDDEGALYSFLKYIFNENN